MRIMYIMSNMRLTGLGLVAAIFFAPHALAQSSPVSYPNHLVRIVVPYLPGGGVDTAARVVGQKMAEVFNQPVVIENKPGAATNIGSDFVAKAAPDGYTLLLSNSSQVANVSLYGKAMPYDLLRDLGPVTMIGTTPVLLVVHPSLPVKTVRDLIALAKAKPGMLTFASAGIGSPTHIAPELFRWMAKIDMLHVPYKGGSQAVTDVIGGQLDFALVDLGGASTLLRSKKLRALAVTGEARSPEFTDVPTVKESGLAEYVQYSWNALFVRSETPDPIREKIADAVQRVMTSADTFNFHAQRGTEVRPLKSDQIRALQKEEIARFRTIANDVGFTR